ncbi:MAG: hypothetical protein P1U63_01640 [Coxiellaceae bacterium]|nr:hypothetical protein [Coxiellaceae bacterium]
MPNKIAQLKETIDDWGPKAEIRDYNSGKVLALLTLIDEKKLCDLNFSIGIIGTVVSLCNMSGTQRDLIMQLDSSHIKLLLSLTYGQFNQVVTDNLEDIKNFCIILDKQSALYGYINWDKACQLNQLGSGIFAKALNTASPHEVEIILNSEYDLSEEECSQLNVIQADHAKALLLLPKEQRKRLLELEIDSLNETAIQLSETHVHCDEAKADDIKNGWWLVEKFGYAETMHRIRMASDMAKLKELIAEAYTLNGLGKTRWDYPEGAKIVIEKFGKIKLPEHYPLDAPASISDESGDTSNPLLNELNSTIDLIRNEIAVTLCLRLSAIHLVEKTTDTDKETDEKKTESASTVSTLVSIFTMPVTAISSHIQSYKVRHPKVAGWYKKAHDFFPNQVNNPPSSCASPTSVSSADEASPTETLPVTLESRRPGL